MNRRGGEVLGRPAHRVAAGAARAGRARRALVPAAALEQAVDDAIAAGARAIVAITGGERDGDAGGARDAAIAARVRAAGVAAAGPELPRRVRRGRGARARLQRPPARRDRPDLPERQPRARDRRPAAAAVGLGFSRFASLGNQVDMQAAELVRALAAHEPTRVIALYAEDLGDGRGFAAAASGRAASPCCCSRSSTPRRRSAPRSSHTGALVSDALAVEAACAAAGIRRVRSPRELVDTAEALLRLPRARGRRVAVAGRRRRARRAGRRARPRGGHGGAGARARRSSRAPAR